MVVVYPLSCVVVAKLAWLLVSVLTLLVIVDKSVLILAKSVVISVRSASNSVIWFIGVRSSVANSEEVIESVRTSNRCSTSGAVVAAVPVELLKGPWISLVETCRTQ